MHQPGSITDWVSDLAISDNDAARCVWDRYFQQLVALARKQLRGKSWGGVDEEDVALSALDSFICRRGAGEYPQLGSRDDVWKLLAVITRRKALNTIRREMAQRRGGALQVGQDFDLLQAFRDEPTPEQAAEVLDEARRLLDDILAGRDGSLRAIALGKLQGEDNAALAAQIGVSRRTVERKLELIRLLWEQDLQDRDP
ncbi:MAG: ECF-type sigma factor [Pirellulaceae bacterium]